MLSGRYALDWWRHRHQSPHTTYTTLDAAIDAVSRVVAGLHEDIDALRRELRAAVHLPPETEVPHLVSALHGTRLLAWTSIVLNLIGGVTLIWFIAGR